jgi:hypothetical protein
LKETEKASKKVLFSRSAF